MAKVQISIDDELLSKVDICADEMYMSRSGFFSYAVSQVVSQTIFIKAIKDMSLSFRKIAETGEMDEEVMKQLEEFERFKNMFSPEHYQLQK